MLRCWIIMVVLASLTWAVSEAAVACDHGATSHSEVSQGTTGAVLHEAPSLQAAPMVPIHKCAATCPGACCCNGGALPCASGQAASDVNGGFDLIVLAAIVRAGRWSQQAVYYREPLYGLDRPPKV
jgi:hypothetical protein